MDKYRRIYKMKSNRNIETFMSSWTINYGTRTKYFLQVVPHFFGKRSQVRQG